MNFDQKPFKILSLILTCYAHGDEKKVNQLGTWVSDKSETVGDLDPHTRQLIRNRNL